METVADECGRPAEEDAAQTFSFVDCAPGLEVRFVEGRVDLAAAFYEVEGGYGCVGWAAGWEGNLLAMYVWSAGDVWRVGLWEGKGGGQGGRKEGGQYLLFHPDRMQRNIVHCTALSSAWEALYRV